MIVEKVAFELKERGYKIRASYLEKPNNGDALIELWYGRKKVKKMFYPAYKIYNLAAHFSDIVDSEIANDERGYAVAGAMVLVV